MYVTNVGKGKEFIEKLKNCRIFAFYFIGSTFTSTIPGISIAGPNPEGTLYTPTLDVEYVVLGKPKTLNVIPVTPEGIPTPAIITRTCLQLCKIPYLIVNCGTYVEPKIPHIKLPSAKPGNRIDSGNVLPIEIVEGLFNEARELAKLILKDIDYVLIGESIPGGTTTALGILIGLGYNAWGKVSSASPSNPHDLKKRVVEEGLRKSGIRLSKDNDPFKIVSCLGDPVHISIAGFVYEALSRGINVVLAGGTQMAAVLAILKSLGTDLKKYIIVATTRWIVNDKSSNLVSLIEEIEPDVPIVAVNLDFSNAPYEGLRKYEEGYVKEGVGAGGTTLVTYILTGKSIGQICQEIYKEYERLLKTS